MIDWLLTFGTLLLLIGTPVLLSLSVKELKK